MLPETPKARSNWLSRNLDQYGGRLVLRGIAAIQRQKPMLPVFARVGLCTFGAIGDAIIASALITDLKRALPDVHVTLVVSETNKSVASLLTHCDEVLVVPVLNPVTAVRLLRKQRFDVLIDANQWLRISAVICALAGAGCTIGFETAGQSRHFAYSVTVPHSASRHELDNYRALLVPLGINGTALPRIDAAPGLRNQALGKRFVVFHPWAGGSNAELKQWPDASWVELASFLSRQGLEIIVTGSAADAAATDRLCGLARQDRVTMSRAASGSLADTASLIADAAFVVSVNTGIAHLAAAVGTAVICLHGPTNPQRWRPLGEASIVVVPDSPPEIPVGYLHLGFEFPKNVAPCMQFITVEQVVGAIRSAGLLDHPVPDDGRSSLDRASPEWNFATPESHAVGTVMGNVKA